MDDKPEEKKKQKVSCESDCPNDSAEEHKEALKNIWTTFAATGVIIIAILVLAFVIGWGWFASNTRVSGTMGTVSPAVHRDFSLATLGTKTQGVYDGIFHLSDSLETETIDGTEFYVASANSSFRVGSDKNLNNYLANADLRPGSSGSFDLYVIRRTRKSEMVLRPVFSAWYENSSKGNGYKDAFTEENTDAGNAAEFLKGHFLLFTDINEKGMYSGNIDFTKQITVDFSGSDGPAASQNGSAVLNDTLWGEKVCSEGETEVYRLPVYWVWPEQFGNFIYTGNSYNKNLFADKSSADYTYFLSEMQGDSSFKKFFLMEDDIERPPLETITSPKDYNTATKNYELYSSWYNAADEEIATRISYIELGFEVTDTD